jgi:hypothetical protein
VSPEKDKFRLSLDKLDEHFDSIEEDRLFAIRWWHQQQPTGEPATQAGLGLKVSTESGSRRTLRQLQGGTLQR